MPVPHEPVRFVKPGDPRAWPVCAGGEGRGVSSMGESCLGSLLGFQLHLKMLFALLCIPLQSHLRSSLSILLPCSKMGLRISGAATGYPQIYQLPTCMLELHRLCWSFSSRSVVCEESGRNNSFFCSRNTQQKEFPTDSSGNLRRGKAGRSCLCHHKSGLVLWELSVCRERNTQLIDEKATLAVSRPGLGLPVLIRSSLCESLCLCSEAGQGERRRKGKFSEMVE